MSAGLYSCANLAEVQLKADEIWADSAKQKDYIAKVGALTAVRDHQTVQLVELNDPMKDNSVKLIWAQNCDETTAACSDECSATGNEPEAGCETVSIDSCRVASFSIEEKGFRAIALTKEEALAKSFLKKMKGLDEYMAAQMVAKLNTNKGANAYTGGKGTVSGFQTSINAAYWNASLFSYFALVAEKNKFSNPYGISGTNLYEAYWQATKNTGNADGKGAAAMFDSLPITFDVFNVDAQLDPEKATFIVDSNAMGFFTKNYYKIAPGSAEADKWGGVGGSVGQKFQMESKNLPGVFYDVTYKVRCSANKIYHDFSLQVNYGIFRSPVGCGVGNTGILKFVCS